MPFAPSVQNRSQLRVNVGAMWEDLGTRGQYAVILCGSLGLYFLVSIIAGIVFNARCCETAGLLDNSYTIVTRPNSYQYYKVGYVFYVDGVSYTGKDTLSTEPTDRTARVFYDPSSPSWNKLRRASLKDGVIGTAFMLGITAFLIRLSWPKRTKNSAEG